MKESSWTNIADNDYQMKSCIKEWVVSGDL